MTIWKSLFTLDDVKQFSQNTLVEHLGIRVIEIGDDYIRASMPVDHRTHQPMGILHGGATVALAETVGSIAAQMAAKPGSHCVGLEINANHIRSIKTGYVFATATAFHLGRSTQVWQIEIVDEEGRKIAVSRLTMVVLD